MDLFCFRCPFPARAGFVVDFTPVGTTGLQQQGVADRAGGTALVEGGGRIAAARGGQVRRIHMPVSRDAFFTFALTP